MFKYFWKRFLTEHISFSASETDSYQFQGKITDPVN